VRFHDEGRREPQDARVVAGAHEDAALEQEVAHGVAREPFLELETEQEPRTSDSAYGTVQRGRTQRVGRRAHVLEEAGRRDAPRNLGRSREHERPAAERRAERAVLAVPGEALARDGEAIGRPPAAPFAVEKTSGKTPNACDAQKAPRRPLPVCTSSKTSAAPERSQSSRSVSRKPCGGSVTPASDWIGSRITAPTLASIAARAASTSPKGMRRTSNGVLGKAFLPSVIAAAPAVRPWKAPVKHTTPLRPVESSASLSAFSFASAPLFEQKTCHASPASSGSVRSNACKNSWRGEWSSRFVANDSFFHWRVITRSRPRSPAPSVFTQCPP